MERKLILTESQLNLITSPLDATIFLEGPAGTGKTTVGVERLLHLMAQGVPANEILLVVPQRSLATRYYEALTFPGVVAGGMVSIVTVGGLARRMVELFWPLISEEAGFGLPNEPPVFLTLETAQYYMARLVRPLFEQGYFESVAISRNRLYSQILDNLNKAALVGFPHTEIGQRLKDAWVGETSQANIYDNAQDCASRFRQYCLAHNLLDFSLQLEVFLRFLWLRPECQKYLKRTYRHLIVDNLEEDTPVAHDLLNEWLPDFDSTLLIYDQEAGYRRFLGADPQTGYALENSCQEQVVFNESLVTSVELVNFCDELGSILAPSSYPHRRANLPKNLLSGVRAALTFEYHRYYPEMLDWVTTQITHLIVDDQVPPGEIVVLAPFLPDALRFSLMNRLEQRGVPVRSHRPSRALREEAVTKCLLTLSALAHPSWEIHPSRFDVAYTFVQAIEGMDLVRAQLLAEIVYRVKKGASGLSSFDPIKPDMQERITYVLGQCYEGLREWIEDYTRHPPEEFDFFLNRLFGELLSQPGYGFHQNLNAGEVTANLIESARKFRWAIGEYPSDDKKPLGQEYLEMVQDGVVAAQYLRSWQIQAENAVLIAPAYTFLMRNQPVDVQFWLDIGSRGWFERLNQPLTQPYVLSRNWPEGQVWTDIEENQTSQEALWRLTVGLIRRCRRMIFLGLSELGEQGYEQQGPLLKAIQRVLRNIPAEKKA